eukprot:Opistho-1_new@46160
MGCGSSRVEALPPAPVANGAHPGMTIPIISTPNTPQTQPVKRPSLPERGSIADLASRPRVPSSSDAPDFLSSRKSESGSSRKSSGVSLTADFVQQVKKESLVMPVQDSPATVARVEAIDLKKSLFTRAFFNVDTQMTGRIRADELKRVFEELGVHHTQYMVEEAARTLKTADGYIGARQFSEWAEHTWGWIVNEKDQPTVGTLGAVLEVDGESDLDMVDADRKRDILLSMFKAADKENTGKIAREGLLAIFKKLGWDVTKGGINNAISMLDKDNNGVLSYDEFLNWFDFAWRYRAYDKNADTVTGKSRKENTRHAKEEEVVIKEASFETD